MNGKSPARGLAHQGLSKEKFATECVWWLGFSRMFSFFPFVMVCVPPSPVISCGERGGHKRGGRAGKEFTAEGYGISAKHFTAPQTLPGLGKPWAAQPCHQGCLFLGNRNEMIILFPRLLKNSRGKRSICSMCCLRFNSGSFHIRVSPNFLWASGTNGGGKC